MNYYELRAKSLTGDLVTFTIADIPVVIRESSFILFNRKSSPILRRSPITHSANYKGLFEGDIVLCEGEEYCVVYETEFKFQKRNGTTVELDGIQNFKKISTIYDDNTWNIPLRYQDTYKYQGIQFTVDKILGCYNDKVYIIVNKEYVDLTELQQDTRVYTSTRKIFFGDLVDGCPVILYKGKPAIQKRNKYYSIIDKKEIK